MASNKGHPLKNLDLYLIYAYENLIEKNVIYDHEEICYYLQIAYKNFNNEFLTIINYDKEYNIQNLKIFNSNYSTDSYQSIVKQSFNKEEGGSILVMNHSTEDSIPSEADEVKALSFVDFYKLHDKELYDVYIVSQQEVYSFADESYKDHVSFLKLKVNQEYFEEKYSNNMIYEIFSNLISPSIITWFTSRKKLMQKY